MQSNATKVNKESVSTMQVGKVFLYLFCCVICLASSGSANKCWHSPDTNCNQENLLAGWFFQPASRKQCIVMDTCSNSSYFSSKEECEKNCALKCTEPTPRPPYMPNTVIITKEVQGGSGLTYSSFSTCGRGFILTGSSERKCDTNGNWTGEEPICYEIVMTVHVNQAELKYKLDSKNILEVKEGEQLMITCAVKETTSIDHSMVWRKMRGQTTYRLPAMHDMREGKDIMKKYIYIQIDRASSVHSGAYSCMSQNNPRLSRNFTIRVKDPKRAPKIMLSSIMIDQKTIKLHCYAYGKPTPVIDWYKDGVIVHGDEKEWLTGPEDTLVDITIKNPNCTHIGKYVCKAENEHGIKYAEKSVTKEDIGLSDEGSGGDECREPHNESCFLCPFGKAPVVKTCNTSDTVISVQLIINETSLNNNTFMINESKVLKGSVSSNLNKLKLTKSAAERNCPTLNSQSWYICTGTINEDMLIVSEKDMVCATSDNHQKKVENHCKLYRNS